MHHSIMIMAHKDIEQICRLVSYFSQDCDVFIHFDKKNELTTQDIERMMQYPQVRQMVQTHEVHWGGTSVLDCEMSLIRLAYNESNADYYHLLSGQDYPIRPLCQFLKFFEDHQDDEKKEFIQFTHLPNPGWEKNTFRRLQYFYPYDVAGDKANPKQWVAGQVREQLMRGIKRPLPDEFDHIYGGSQWFSISRDAVKTLLDYTDRNPSFYRRMWMTFAPEECYVATILVNLLGEDKIENTNHRFIRWKNENGNYPANLGTEHFHYLVETDSFFARKIELPSSAKLLKQIDRYLHHDIQIKSMPTGGWDYDGFLAYEYNDTFCEFVQMLWCDIGAKTAVDIGCGAGHYVAAWRDRKLSFAGYDINPNTPKLSAMLLPDDDEPCGVADITDELEIDTPFDLVVCKDVLPYVPAQLESIAIHNLAMLSSHIILVSWGKGKNQYGHNYRELSMDYLAPLFEAEGFVIENYLTARMHISLTNKNNCIFIRKGTSIIDKLYKQDNPS